VTHTVEVTAATLYEAVAQGLAAIRGNDWVAGVAQGLNVVKVSVADVRVEHEVKLMEFTKWRRRRGRTRRLVALSLAKMTEIRTGNGRTVALLRFAK
jgi:hypothetical protein